ncbi:uncharacterized protein LOC141886255 isoform X5 [Acropora palmata]|uniref:uncharacterized protein LOC141886255 isoform X5 n=1 Tax=Acropora palmata TaxID=6131 RepID=UPI003D9FB5C9
MEALGRPEKRGFFEEDRLPPQLSVKVITISDVPYESWSDVNLPIDILLIVENDFELSSCLSFLDQPFKSANKEVGHVYFGRIGNASNEEKLKVALVKCSKEAASPEGSLTVAMKAVEILQPKAVFFVGTCIGLSSKKVSLGDVVIPSKLTAAVGSKVLASSRLGDLARDVTNKWVAPLQNPNALEVKVHHSSNILKQSLTVDHTSDDLHELYPEAIAVETEGISLEAYDDIEWVIVKGVTSYFNQTKSSTSGWMSFASTMAASIVASMLKDPVVFQKWSHYSQERVLMSFKGSPSEMEELQRMIFEARLEKIQGYRMLSEGRLVKEFRRIPKARSEAMQEYRERSEARLRMIEEFVLRARSFKRSPTEVEEWRSISEEKWKQREASDVKEGKGDKKAIDEEGRQYGGNEGKDDEGGAEPDKTEIQGQVRYEQDTYDDDLGTQISETTEEDLFHGIHELQMEEQEATERVTIFKGTVTSEGFHVDLNVGAIHLTFPPDAVAELTDIMVYRWKYGACLPQLTEHEAVVSNVVEISASTEEGGLRFNSEVKLVLSHSAADLEGYELVLKRLTDTETNEWEEIAGCENIRQVSDIEDDYPCPTNVQYSFPVVRAGITKCSTYAVVSRLKLSPAYTITVSGGTFPHPDYPQVTITVPEKAVETETKLSLQLKVQEVPQDKFQGHNLFAGPILRILCSSRATFLEPVTIQLPLSLRGSVVKVLHPSVCRVRVFFLCSERETKEWIEISDKLENPAIYDGKLVKFKVRHFSKLTYVLDRASDSFSAVSSKITSYLSSITWNPSLVAFFFAYFKPGESLNGHDILFLTCCPAHLREEVKQEHEREGVTPGVVSSNGKMVPDHDEAFVSVSGGISRPASSGEMENFSLCLYRDTQHKAQHEVCQESVRAYCGVMFRDKNSNLLAKLHLILPSPTMDHQETPGAVNGNPARVSSGGDASPVERNDSASSEDRPVGASGVEGNENVSSEDQAVDASPVERNDSASSEDRPETSPAPQGSESESLLESAPSWCSPETPKPEYKNDRASAFWDVPVYAEKTEVRTNRIDARVVDKQRKKVLLLEKSCPWMANRKQEEEEKTSKYAPLRWD